MKRTVAALLSLFVAAPLAAPRQPGATSSAAPLSVYAGAGERIVQFHAGLDTASLVERGAVTLPGYVQEAWLHASKPLLYVAWSDGGPLYASVPAAAVPAPRHSGISTFAIDPSSGALTSIGTPTPLRSRPVYITCDHACAHVLAAYNEPSGISVHAVRDDGTPGGEMPQPADLDVGIYGHQVRVSPSNGTVVFVTRGNEPTATTREDPGAVKLFRYRDGALANLASIATNGGVAFRSRHVDFHPAKPWMFLTLESQNQLLTYPVADGDTPARQPAFVSDTLAAPSRPAARQAASSVHVHPNGTVVYVANRATGTVDVAGRAVFAGGENSIAVFALDERTGEPRRIQTADSRGIQPRTFAVDPAGRLLVVANLTSMFVRDGGNVKRMTANLAVFRIDRDGRLTFVGTHTVGDGSAPLLWVGIVARRTAT
jgi:6-phosphogluconolactonase